MKKKNILLSGILSASIATLVPLTVISCSKNQDEIKKVDENKTANQKNTINELFAQIKTVWKDLNDTQKNDAVNELTKLVSNSGIKLSEPQKHKIIQTLNKDVGSFGAVIWFIKSVEAKIAKEQAYEFAKIAFDKLLYKNKDHFDTTWKFDGNNKTINAPTSGKSIPVVFMDIDETVLQNEWTQANNMLTGGHSHSKKEKQDLLGNRNAIPGAVDFINHVHSNGGLVFYNSDMNQSTAIRDAVKKNLKAVGVKYVEDFQFWMKGAIPYLHEEEAKASKENKDDAKTFNEFEFKNQKFSDTKFRSKPWLTWNTSDDAHTYGGKFNKTIRMQAVDKNSDGWALQSPEVKIKLKTMMKVGDNFDDFFDSISKYKTNSERNQIYDNQIKDYFKFEGSNVKHFNTVSKKLEDVNSPWKQVYIMVPGNALYGGWNREYGYGSVEKFYEAIKEIQNDPKYKKDIEPSTSNK
ncbi:hypothetical protein JS510_01425 [Mycoplasma tauri]|uniref:HAD family acid phosphatase n=1 Tax=Mycoplasma tauri TaxID=547987 RepID=UPI001967A0E7|nr:HAD family acid phosphatase [Mycoplasma tauri]QSB07766.1 hypothetical protein JS510_01425 [Mycoplasma tauri]